MPLISNSEKKEGRHTQATQRSKTHQERHTSTTTKTAAKSKNSKPATPTTPRTAPHETSRRPSQNNSTKIVPARKAHLQTMVMRPTTNGRCEWKLEVKGPTPGKTIVEHGISIRSGDKITTALYRVEHLGGDHKRSERKDAGGSKKPSAGHRVEFQDTPHRKSRG